MKSPFKISKKLMFILVLILLVSLVLVSSLLIDITKRKKEQVEGYALFGDFVLYDEVSKYPPLVGCLINVEGFSNMCFKVKNQGFYKADFLGAYPDVQLLPSGFYIFEFSEKSLREYSVDRDELFEKWYTELVNAQDEFSKEVGGVRHVDAYNLCQLRNIQMSKGDLSSDDYKAEMDGYVGKEYNILFPMKYSDFDYTCSISKDMCSFWERKQSIPYSIIEDFNDNPEFDFENKKLIYSSVGILIRGLNSLNTSTFENDYMLLEYEEFMANLLEKSEFESRDKVLFMGEYIPFFLLDLLDTFYENWEGESRDYYLLLLDSSCGSEECLEIKLNILYDAY